MTAEEHSELRAFFDDESKLSDTAVDARDDRWAESGAREAILAEPWGHVLNGVDPQVLFARGMPTIEIPEGTPNVG